MGRPDDALLTLPWLVEKDTGAGLDVRVVHFQIEKTTHLPQMALGRGDQILKSHREDLARMLLHQTPIGAAAMKEHLGRHFK
jgi:hypothetical protein